MTSLGGFEGEGSSPLPGGTWITFCLAGFCVAPAEPLETRAVLRTDASAARSGVKPVRGRKRDACYQPGGAVPGSVLGSSTGKTSKCPKVGNLIVKSHRAPAGSPTATDPKQLSGTCQNSLFCFSVVFLLFSEFWISSCCLWGVRGSPVVLAHPPIPSESQISRHSGAPATPPRAC